MSTIEIVFICIIAVIGFVISSICFYLIGQNSIKRELIILKTNPCQVETMLEARELIESGAECDEVEVIDVSNYKIPDDVNEFSIEDSGYNGKPGKIKHYKRNRDRIFKEVETQKQ